MNIKEFNTKNIIHFSIEEILIIFINNKNTIELKKKYVKKKGIKLICIPSKYDYTNPLEMCEYILDNL